MAISRAVLAVSISADAIINGFKVGLKAGFSCAKCQLLFAVFGLTAESRPLTAKKQCPWRRSMLPRTAARHKGITITSGFDCTSLSGLHIRALTFSAPLRSFSHIKSFRRQTLTDGG
jgi:hypothetical protein